MFRFTLLFVLCFGLNLTAIELVDKTKKVQKNATGNELAEDGKPIYKALENIIKEPMHNITLEPMNVPIIYAIGDTPKPQAPAKEIQKPKPIDKTKYFVEKKELQKEEFKQEKIKLDDGKAFFETLNEKESKPIDIEK